MQESRLRGSAMPDAHRLPTSVVPRSYDLHLTADPERPDFAGSVRIDVEIREAVTVVTVNGRGLAVATALLEQGDRVLELAVEVDEEAERLLLRLPSGEEAAPGPATLELHYAGQVGQAMAGLYLSVDGDRKCLATQCEATDARAIVPCFDEPLFKARWAWTITAPEGLQVLANGRLEDSGPAEGVEGAPEMTTWRFATTPPMSSYLIACCIGAFGGTEPAEAAGATAAPHRVWALDGQEALGVHSRDFAVRLQAWYEDYFGVDYHWGHYDQVAVPSFSFGAMENPGLVVFRPSLLLADPEQASWRALKQVDLVVAHEFAHMWFGNLVTMAWWDDLWLNEAFAEWIAHKAVHALEPSHEVWMDFEGRTGGALATDALDATHAIYHPVQTPEEAQELFDAITYGKGSAVMRMLEAYLGEEAFRAGLRTYMQAFGESNARGADLWQHLEEASGQPVAAIMESWITQPGHPLVHMGFDAATGTLTLRQERARLSPGDAPADTWQVPLVLRYEDDAGIHEHRHLLTEAEGTVALPVAGTLKWLAGNGEGVGFYRVAPDAGLLAGARRHAARLHPAERIGLLRDQWGLVRCGRQEMAAFLDLLEDLARPDDHFAVVDHVVALARDLERMLEREGDKEAEALAGMRRWIAQALPVDLEASGKSAPERERQAALLRAAAGIARDPEALAHARALAAAERDDPAQVDSDLAGVAVSASALAGDEAHFEAHLATYLARRDGGASPQETERYTYTFPAFRDPALVDRVLGLLADESLPQQAVGPVLRLMLIEPHSQRAAWAFLTKEWDDLKERLGEAWVGILVEAAGGLPVDLEEEMVAFFDKQLGASGQQAFGRAKEQIALRREFTARTLPALSAWARRHGAS
ncbi:MAG: M1 family metallopeptidase [Thermoplasmatota archaeon]